MGDQLPLRRRGLDFRLLASVIRAVRRRLRQADDGWTHVVLPGEKFLVVASLPRRTSTVAAYGKRWMILGTMAVVPRFAYRERHRLPSRGTLHSYRTVHRSCERQNYAHSKACVGQP